ncbi:hypothetical protein [Jannaschia ovalis]|uniref:Uncharacterized protein n=1 Tax=Jannaschia ovalis TaxID=3038773 RepID=A0ABY8LD42_9RHOB|nr:hypothetical protein [Jannaschia sp. GRR-S6-38]WGH79241.1 hypothetical protein P8627_02965 [Jannaschia sp. GRR-S6-38]
MTGDMASFPTLFKLAALVVLYPHILFADDRLSADTSEMEGKSIGIIVNASTLSSCSDCPETIHFVLSGPLPVLDIGQNDLGVSLPQYVTSVILFAGKYKPVICSTDMRRGFLDWVVNIVEKTLPSTRLIEPVPREYQGCLSVIESGISGSGDYSAIASDVGIIGITYCSEFPAGQYCTAWFSDESGTHKILASPIPQQSIHEVVQDAETFVRMIQSRYSDISGQARDFPDFSSHEDPIIDLD